MNYYLLLGLLNLLSCLPANSNENKGKKANPAAAEPENHQNLGQTISGIANNSISSISNTTIPFISAKQGNDSASITPNPSTASTTTTKTTSPNSTQKPDVTTRITISPPINNGSSTSTTPHPAPEPTDKTGITPSTTTTTTTVPTPASSSTTIATKPTKLNNVIPTPASHRDRKFDGASFIGGMILTLGFVAIGFVSFKFYKARTELNYHTL